MKSAQEIKDQIAYLASSLTSASVDLRSASTESSHLSGRLNRLTLALAFAAVLTAGATGFQAWQTKRQTDLIEQQSRRVAQPSLQAAPLPAAR